MPRGRIFIISGVSGAGKKQIVQEILKKRKNTLLALSYTTKEKLKEESEYIFIDRKHFLKKVEEGEFLEFSEVYGDLYGTGLDSFKPIEEGKDVIKLLDVQGAMKLRKANVKAKYIFLRIPKPVIRRRLEERNDAKKEVRLKEASEELKKVTFFDHVVVTSTEKREKHVEKVLEFLESDHSM